MLLLGASGLFHAAPAQAQTTTLVSNIGQTAGDDIEVTILNADPPGAPEGLAVAPGDGKLDLSWTPVPGDPEGYDVEYRQLGAATWTDAGHTGTDPSEAITGLTNRRGYQVRVRWSDGDATGPWATGSGIPTVQTLTLSVNRQLAEGGPKVTLTATLGQAAVEARTIWITPSGTATGGIFPYGVDWSADRIQRGDGVLQIPLLIAQGQRTATATIEVVDDEDVDAGETVVLEARANGAVADTAPRNVDLVAPLVSNTLTLTIEDNEEGPPGPTTALTVTPGDGKLDLSWTAPSDNGGSVVTGYHVHYTSAAAGIVADDGAVQTGASPSPATGWVAVSRSGTTAVQQITGLSNGTTYRVRVRAENINGAGPWEHATGRPLMAAQSSAAGTVWSATFTPSDIGGGNVGCLSKSACDSALTDNSFTVGGTEFGFEHLSYSTVIASLDVRVDPDSNAALRGLQFCSGALAEPMDGGDQGNQVIFDSLSVGWQAGVPVEIRIGSDCAVMVPLSAVQNLIVTPRNGELSLQWSSPLEGAATGYEWEWKAQSAPDAAATTANDPSTGWVRGSERRSISISGTTITGLVNGTTYNVRVRPIGDGDPGPWATADATLSGGGAGGGGGGGGGGGEGAPDLTVAPPVVTIVAMEEAVTEGGAARFTVRATPVPAPGTSLSVRVRVSQRGDVASSGEIRTHTVVVDDSGTASFSVSTEDDAVHEEDGILTVMVEQGSGYTPHASSNSAEVTIRDNDHPVVSVEAVEDAITEGGAARFTVRATPVPRAGAPLNVRVRVSQRGDFASPSQIRTHTVVVDEGGSAVFSVSTQDDAIDEEDGILTAVVEEGSGYTPHASSNSAAVTVRDNDPAVAPPTAEQRGWLLRFGRTVSQQVVDALQQRFSSSTQAGLELTLAGESLTSATPLEENHVLLSRLLGFEKVSSQQLAQGSSFNFSGDGAGPRLSFWGSGALSSFNGSENTFNLRGDVTTALLGAEWSSERWRAGAALSHSRGSGSYQGSVAGGGRGAGDISGALTGLFPYGRYALSPRLGIWATAGYGWGSLSHNPDGYALEYNPVATMSMGALGMEGLLLEGGSDGVTLTTTADLLVLKTSSEAVEGLPSSNGNLSRFRLGLEATRPFLLRNGSSLSPSLELGIRQDRGDAETGFGIDLGAAVTWSAPESGVSAVVKGRTLLSHGAEHFQEKGLALSFSWQPTPSERGVSLSLSHAVGGAAEGGMASLLHPTAIEVLDAASSDGERFEARLAYGFPFYNDRLTITPSVAAALSPSSRSYSLLWSVAPYAEQLQLHGEEPWELSLEGERQENLSSSPSSPVDHSLKLLFSLPL